MAAYSYDHQSALKEILFPYSPDPMEHTLQLKIILPGQLNMQMLQCTKRGGVIEVVKVLQHWYLQQKAVLNGP